MNIKHKKVLAASALVMMGAFTTGCRTYNDFKTDAAYEVDENGYAKITGYVTSDDLREIGIYKSSESSIYFCYVPLLQSYRYDIFSTTGIYKGDIEFIEFLHDYMIRKGYELKVKYTEEDLRNIYDEYVNEYNKNNKEENLKLEKSVD